MGVYPPCIEVNADQNGFPRMTSPKTSCPRLQIFYRSGLRHHVRPGQPYEERPAPITRVACRHRISCSVEQSGYVFIERRRHQFITSVQSIESASTSFDA